MSKRFLVNGKTELRGLEKQVDELEKEFEKSRSGITDTIKRANDGLFVRRGEIVATQIQTRYLASQRLNKDINSFLRTVADRHQPAQKLHDATVRAASVNRLKSDDDGLASLSIQGTVPLVERDRRVTLGGRALQIRAECTMLEDKFIIAGAVKYALSVENVKLPGGSPDNLTKPFFQTCKTFLADCNTENLPKLAVETSIYFARIVRLYQSCGLSDSDKIIATEYSKEATEQLQKALLLCKQPFQDAEQLKKAVEDTVKLLQREWYEEVTPEELRAIKQAMVRGPRGIATHSGHWYNCVNGHPVRINSVSFQSLDIHLPPQFLPQLSCLGQTDVDHSLVRNRRMWYANGAGTLSRMRSACRWIKSSGCCRRFACYRDGEVK
jgi:hypothetical protein